MRRELIAAVALGCFAASPAMASLQLTDGFKLLNRTTTTTRTTSQTSLPSTSTQTAVTTTVKAPVTTSGKKRRNSKPTTVPPSLPVVPLATATTVDFNSIDSGLLNTYNTDTFGALLSGTGDFSNTFDFTLNLDSIANGKLSTIDLSGIGVDFTHIFLDGAEQVLADSQNWVLSPTALSSGPHSIVVNGTVGSGGSGSYSGNFNIAAAGAVPEPATWALMLVGFMGVGYSMRRRRSSAITQLA